VHETKLKPKRIARHQWIRWETQNKINVILHYRRLNLGAQETRTHKFATWCLLLVDGCADGTLQLAIALAAGADTLHDGP
jgi:hypothetical protein